jgi:hypothetical protein
LNKEKTMARSRIKLGREIKRQVPVLFPRTQAEVTPEQITHYAKHHPYAFAIYRQSDERELTRAEATGCHRRVAAITAAAKELHVYLPEPVRNEQQQSGAVDLEGQRFRVHLHVPWPTLQELAGWWDEAQVKPDDGPDS